MNKCILLIVLLLSLFVVSGERADAQETLKLKSTPKAFQVFYEKFRTAVVKGDKKSVAAMTNFPFQYGFDVGDEGTFTKAQFIKKFDSFFGGERTIFNGKKVEFYSEKAGSYTLNDEWDASSFAFEKKGTTYKFTAYIASP